ncbi:MAG: DUF2937 family protein [Pelagimonas sp.]|jgi:hypothetical protein|nr:DUF2937 family protein [Pelagimonas sp.]
MITRALTMAGAVTGALGLSQFPEFSQQYMQRLGGAVDELSRQITRYEADAADVDMTLAAYLDQLSQEGALAKTQSENMAFDIARHARLSQDLAALEGAGPFMRAKLASHMGDRDIAKRAFEAYKPAVPATFEGAMFAGTGFFGVWAFLAGIIAFFRRLWRGLRGAVLRKA